MNDRLPDHSSLTRIRQRWGVERFRAIFTRIVRDCAAAGLAPGEVVHVDATLIRADVSFDSLVEQHLDAVGTANLTEEDRLARRTGKFKKLCATDPDATMATSSQKPRLQPSCKRHTAVDDATGVIVDVEVVTGEELDFGQLAERLDAITQTLDRTPGVVTADAACGVGKVFAAPSGPSIRLPRHPARTLPLRRQGGHRPLSAQEGPAPPDSDAGRPLLPGSRRRLHRLPVARSMHSRRGRGASRACGDPLPSHPARPPAAPRLEPT
jgi:hypothetical protein